MTPAELAGARRRHEGEHEGDRVQLVDVRWPNEWEAGRIEGAVHIPSDELDDRLHELDPDRPVVTVCRTGSRSAAAAEQLRAEGFTVENLEGGVQAWVDQGLPFDGQVVDPEPPPDDRPPELQRLQAEFLDVLMAVQEHFGDRDPSDDEVRAFLRQRLIDQGRSPEDADEFLAGIEAE